MSTRCISCKREISAKQQSCYICGVKQNYLSYYSKPLFASIITLVFVVWFANNTLNNGILDFQTKHAEETTQQINQFNEKQKRLEKEILDLTLSKSILEENIKSLESKVADGSSSSDDTQKLLDKEKNNTALLRKENNRFSTKIKTLTEHISILEQRLNETSSDAVLNNKIEPVINEPAIDKPLLINPEIQNDASNLNTTQEEDETKSESGTDL